MIDTFTDYFDEIYLKTTGTTLFIRNRYNQTIIKRFLYTIESRYEGSFGKDTLWDFMIFNFRHYDGMKTRFGKNNVQLNWIAGNKAIERWEDKKEGWKYWNGEYVRKYGIKRPGKKEKEETEGAFIYKKQERLRFYGSEMGLVHCNSLDLFDYISKECMLCNHRKVCVQENKKE